MHPVHKQPRAFRLVSLMVAALALVLARAEASANPGEKAAELANTVCAACHGGNGLSISDTIPNLAGQRAAYLENQLRALRDGSRKSGVMNAIAAQIPEADLRGLATHYAAMPGAQAGSARSAPLAALTGSRMSFPSDYREKFQHYLTMNFPATRQVRKFFASPSLLDDLAAGRVPAEGAAVLVEVYAAQLDDKRQPIAGSDGFFQAEKLLFYTGMAVGKGWGDSIPAMLKNGDWQYAVFGQDRAPRQGFSQGECLACHRPLESAHYLFTQKSLAEARTKRP